MKNNKLNKPLVIICVITWLIAIGVVYFFVFANRSRVTEISFTELSQKMEDDETFIIYIGSSNCGACQTFTPTLDRVIKDYDVTIFYINVHKLNETERGDLLALINYQSSTPKLYFVKEGEYSQYNAIRGAQSYENVVEKLKKNGYIK